MSHYQSSTFCQIIIYHMSSRQNPLHVTSCYCCCYRFWGGACRFPGFCGYQHVRDPTWSQKPILNRLGNASRSCFVGFRCFGNNSCSFLVAFICMHVPQCFFHLRAYSFHFAFISRHFLSFSFHVPFICINFLLFPCIHSFFVFIPMRIHVLSSSFLLLFNLHACSFHFAFISFDVLSKVMEMALRLGQGTECNKWLSLGYR